MPFALDSSQIAFPHPQYADDDGLLAVGGDLTPARLALAYQHGIFPWYSADTPILWYAPQERFVLSPNKIVISKSMRKVLSLPAFQLSFNRSFEQVIAACATVQRAGQDGTWIVEEMITAYVRLHDLGLAHSVEVWQEGVLVGGLYGVLVGKVFCGESMFSTVSNASKAALIYLCQHFDLELIDCQIYSQHLASLGAETMSQQEFLDILARQEYQQYGLQELFRHPG